ncbi:MAG: hypothetical protein WCT22_00170 [Patescibacteria group bacterium]|jgi:hypothetical protein
MGVERKNPLLVDDVFYSAALDLISKRHTISELELSPALGRLSQLQYLSKLEAPLGEEAKVRIFNVNKSRKKLFEGPFMRIAGQKKSGQGAEIIQDEITDELLTSQDFRKELNIPERDYLATVINLQILNYEGLISISEDADTYDRRYNKFLLFGIIHELLMGTKTNLTKVIDNVSYFYKLRTRFVPHFDSKLLTAHHDGRSFFPVKAISP